MAFVLIFFIVFLAGLVVLAGWGIKLYNHLVFLRNQVRNAWAQIDVVLIRRYDLIPNLVEVAKTYLSHERETLEAVIQARNQAQRAEKTLKDTLNGTPSFESVSQSQQSYQAAESVLTQSLGRLMAVVEDYPELKANTIMQNLQAELTDTENKVAQMRQFYNQAVQDYDTYRQSVPQVWVANTFNFQAMPFLEAEAAHKEPPKVKF